MKHSSATRDFRIDLLTSQQHFQKSVQTNKMQKSFLFVCLSQFASRAEFKHMRNCVLPGLLSLPPKHPPREELLALKPALKCLPWEMHILKTRCEQSWAQAISSKAVQSWVWSNTGLGLRVWRALEKCVWSRFSSAGLTGSSVSAGLYSSL